MFKRLLNLDFKSSRVSPQMDNSTVLCCKFYYYPIREKGECIRYILAFCSASYEDVRISFDQWNSSDMASETPFGNLPVLEVNGEKIANTLPIAKYLAKQYNLLPKDSMDQAKCDMFAEEIRNLSDKLRPVTQAAFFFKDHERKTMEWNKYKTHELRPIMNKFETFLSDRKWLCGNKVSWVDLVFAEFADRLESCFDATVLEEFPTLRDHVGRVHQLPSLNAYLQYRPKMDY